MSVSTVWLLALPANPNAMTVAKSMDVTQHAKARNIWFGKVWVLVNAWPWITKEKVKPVSEMQFISKAYRLEIRQSSARQSHVCQGSITLKKNSDFTRQLARKRNPVAKLVAVFKGS